MSNPALVLSVGLLYIPALFIRMSNLGTSFFIRPANCFTAFISEKSVTKPLIFLLFETSFNSEFF